MPLLPPLLRVILEEQRHNININRNSMLPPCLLFFLSRKHIQYVINMQQRQIEIQIRTRDPGIYNALATSLALCHICRTKAITNTNTNSALFYLFYFVSFLS